MPKTTKPTIKSTVKINTVTLPETDIRLMAVSGSGVAFTISGSTAVSAIDQGYASASDVANLCRNLLSGASGFGTSTSPTLTAVNTWLSSGCSIIEANLVSLGYEVPVATGTVLRNWLQHLNALFGAAYAEMSRINVTLNPGERTRGQLFLKQFEDSLAAMGQMNLSAMGATENGTAMSMYVGGVSISDKDTIASNADRVPPKFFRGMFDMPGTKQPEE